jgi:hypothetical protein
MEEQLKYGINLRTHDVPEMVFKARCCERAAGGKNRYPIHRRTRFGARVELEALMDAIALDPSWRAERIHASYIGAGRGEGCSRPGGEAARRTTARAPSTSTLATSPRPRPRATASSRRRRPRASPSRCFTINWHFIAGDQVESAEIEEIADGALMDEAYPEIQGGVSAFIESYLDAKETVLVLQGRREPGRRA